MGLPLTKQDSYANAIYNSATRAQQARKGIKKQGSYEAAVESGAKNQAAAKRTKQILQIRKQDSYTKAIGGSFEDDHSQTSENREPVNKMRKQESYLMAVGEMSPENENSTSALRGRVAASGAASPRIRKQDSYLKAIGNNEDELSPLPRRLVQKQESYQRAILVGGVGSFSGSMNQSEDRTAQMLLIRQEAMEKSSARSSPRISPSTSRTSVTRGSFKKQDSYNRAIEKGYDMIAALDRINNYEEVLREFKTRKESSTDLTSMANVVQASQAETKAAVAIQSAFKGYKIRKEIKEIQTFYQQVSSSEDQIAGRPRPTDFRNSGSSSNEPLSRKKRQDSYLKAVGGLSPDESESESGKQETRTNGGSTTRAWKIRQDSYQQAVEGGAAGSLQRPRRQDSYQQAMGTLGQDYKQKPTRQESYKQAMAGLDPSTIYGNKPRRQDSYQQAMGTLDQDDKQKPRRQDSYLQAVSSDYGGVSPNRSPTSPRHSKIRQDSYQQAVEGRMSQNVNKKKPGRQSSYQQAVGNLSPELIEDLPDLKDPEMAKAAVKIQSVFKGFKVRQKQATAADDLPDLKDPEMAKAALKIQSVFKGFKVRQKKAAPADDLPNLNDKEVQAATVKIQSAFKGNSFIRV